MIYTKWQVACKPEPGKSAGVGPFTSWEDADRWAASQDPGQGGRQVFQVAPIRSS
jgi:hypothetical protein